VHGTRPPHRVEPRIQHAAPRVATRVERGAHVAHGPEVGVWGREGGGVGCMGKGE
ncbi:hypothetical protein K438DRAFT_1852641, partial [Mycena galopus ATCC 62051]